MMLDCDGDSRATSADSLGAMIDGAAFVLRSTFCAQQRLHKRIRPCIQGGTRPRGTTCLRVAVEPPEHVRVLLDDCCPFEFERRRELSGRLGEVERQDGELLDARAEDVAFSLL